MYTGAIFPFSTSSYNQKYLISKCFIRPWCSGFLDTLRADWLSIKRVDAPVTRYPIFPRMPLIHLISLPASTAATNSALVVESVTNSCKLLLQPIAVPPMQVTYPPVDLPLSLLPP